MIVIIDNYDSFVYNLARYVGQLGYKRKVFRNNEVTIPEIEALNPTHIILSPGPCTPNEAGITIELIQHFSSRVPVLGVCLGHQAIGQAFGGKVTKAIKPMHGMSSLIQHTQKGIFAKLVNPLKVARYHSLIIEKDTLPDCLMITALSSENEIMAIQHKDYEIYGVQFHPESILTEHGYDLLQEFLHKRI